MGSTVLFAAKCFLVAGLMIVLSSDGDGVDGVALSVKSGGEVDNFRRTATGAWRVSCCWPRVAMVFTHIIFLHKYVRRKSTNYQTKWKIF
jgi:hypothetical protein